MNDYQHIKSTLQQFYADLDYWKDTIVPDRLLDTVTEYVYTMLGSLQADLVSDLTQA